MDTQQKTSPFKDIKSFFSPNGAADLNVVIRTAVLAGLDSPRPRLEIAAGGALTALSDVADEWAAQVAERSGVALAEVFPGLASRPSGAEHVWAHEAEEQKLHELAFGTAAKRAKVDAAAAKAVVTTKQANLAKAAKGTKSITAFFGRKKKGAP